MNISITSGTEGPRHDPYGYVEYHVTRTDGVKVVGHFGLLENVEVNGAEVARGEGSVEAFTRAVGLSPHQCERAYDRARTRCDCGNRKRFHWVDGFPGESLMICDRCGQIVDTHFDRSAIE